MNYVRFRWSLILLIVACVQLVTRGQVFTSSNLPIVVINTNGQNIVDEPKITADMGIIFNGLNQRNTLTDPFNNYTGIIGIELRGSTSQALFPKKQYGIELRNAAGASIDASLLGLPKRDDWILFAPYDDKSLMRDVLAYKLGRDLGRYASRWKYVELVLNGQYQGIYVLLEKIKRDKNRVNIDKMDPVETTGDNVTGGYIIKIDKTSGNPGDGWTSSYAPLGRSGGQTIYFQYEYPKPEDIVTEQKAYIRNYVDALENNLAGDAYQDPVNGYQKYLDVPSFVDYFIANELARNPDAYRLSTFMYKKKDSDGGKLSMGPIWDFNLGFGNVNFCAKEKPEGFIINYNAICPDDYWLIPFWWNRLFQDPAFKTQVVNRWTSLRSNQYQTSRILGFIDSVASVLNVESQQRNFQRWPVLGQYVWPNAYIGQTFQQEVDWLKDWTTKRLIWMDTNLPTIITGLEESPQNDLWIVPFPNPYTDRLMIEVRGDAPDQLLTVELLDLTGSCLSVVERRLDLPDTYQVEIPAGGLMKPGMYFVKATLGARIKIIKVIRN